MDSVKAARLTRLKRQVDLTPDQEAKAKPIIDKYVDDRHATTDRTKLPALKTQFDSDINAILTPEQRKKLTVAQAATAEKLRPRERLKRLPLRRPLQPKATDPLQPAGMFRVVDGLRLSIASAIHRTPKRPYADTPTSFSRYRIPADFLSASTGAGAFAVGLNSDRRKVVAKPNAMAMMTPPTRNGVFPY